MDNIRLHRHLNPANVVGNPWLILYALFLFLLIASKSTIWPIEVVDFLSLNTEQCMPYLYAKFADWPTSQKYTLETTLPELKDQTLGNRTMLLSPNATKLDVAHHEKPSDCDLETNTYRVCSDHLMLERASIRTPAVPETIIYSPTHAQQFHDIMNVALLVQSKWHHTGRQIACGDIVHVRDTNSIRGNYKMATEIKSNPSTKGGVVRVFELKYLPDSFGPMYTGAPYKIELRDVKKLSSYSHIAEKYLRHVLCYDVTKFGLYHIS